MSGLSAARLDREILLQTATTVQSASGEETFDWDSATSLRLWAQWFAKGTRETFRFQREGSYIDGIFRIYDLAPRPTPDNSRILFEGRVFDLQGVTELGRGEGLDLAVVARGEAP
jgi:head-tail adaptor